MKKEIFSPHVQLSFLASNVLLVLERLEKNGTAGSGEREIIRKATGFLDSALRGEEIVRTPQTAKITGSIVQATRAYNHAKKVLDFLRDQGIPNESLDDTLMRYRQNLKLVIGHAAAENAHPTVKEKKKILSQLSSLRTFFKKLRQISLEEVGPSREVVLKRGGT